jgi:hypothetical protein
MGKEGENCQQNRNKCSFFGFCKELFWCVMEEALNRSWLKGCGKRE